MPDPVWTDGVTPLNSVNMTKLQTRDEKGTSNGYASLDSGGKVPSAQLGSLVSYGTTLPASPVDGQEAILVDSLTAPNYQWRFRYNAGHTGDAYKWEFVGGTPALVAASGYAIPSGWSVVTGSGFLVPRPGYYLAQTLITSVTPAAGADIALQQGPGKNTDSSAAVPANGIIWRGTTPQGLFGVFGYLLFASVASAVIWVNGGASGLTGTVARMSVTPSNVS